MLLVLMITLLKKIISINASWHEAGSYYLAKTTYIKVFLFVNSNEYEHLKFQVKVKMHMNSITMKISVFCTSAVC